MTSQLPPYIQAFSGSIGSVTANGLTYPLDLVTTRVQTSRETDIQGVSGALRIVRNIVRKRGVASLYDGLSTDTAATLVSNYFYFYFYTFLRSAITAHRAANKPAKGTAKVAAQTALAVFEELGAGFVAAVVSRVISTPLSLVTVQLQSEQGNGSSTESITDVIKGIYAEGGLAGFWRGFSATILLSLNPAFSLLMFQVYRKIVLGGRTPGPAQSFLGAAVSNAMAVTILYPLILAKTRLQTYRDATPTPIKPNAGQPSFATAVKVPSDAPPLRKKAPQNVVSVIRAIMKTHGVKGLYQGLEAQVAKGFLSQGVTMLTKERIESVVVAVYLRHIGASR